MTSPEKRQDELHDTVADLDCFDAMLHQRNSTADALATLCGNPFHPKDLPRWGMPQVYIDLP